MTSHDTGQINTLDTFGWHEDCPYNHRDVRMAGMLTVNFNDGAFMIIELLELML